MQIKHNEIFRIYTTPKQLRKIADQLEVLWDQTEKELKHFPQADVGEVTVWFDKTLGYNEGLQFEFYVSCQDKLTEYLAEQTEDNE